MPREWKLSGLGLALAAAIGGTVLLVDATSGRAAVAGGCNKSVVKVGDGGELGAAIARACDGGTIILAPGQYGDVRINNVRPANGLTIKGVSKAASLHSLMITRSERISVSNLTIRFDGVIDRPRNALTIGVANAIRVDDVFVTGGPEDSALEIDLVSIRENHDVAFTSSEVTRGRHAVTILNNRNLKIAGNYVHDMRVDGIRGGGNSDLEVSGNVFTDFYPRGQIGGTGDHADAIQLWTTNTKESAQNITIANNVFYRGKGYPIQGIFLRDQVNTLPYINVRIEGNVIVGGMYNGISAGYINGLQLNDNIVVGAPDQKSWIAAQGTAITMRKNAAPIFLINKDRSTPSGNKARAISREALKSQLQSALKALPQAGATLRQRLID